MFFKQKTHRVLTWQGKLAVLTALLAIAWASWPLARFGITHYIHRVDQPHPTNRIVLENWGGDIDLFENSLAVAHAVQATEIYSIIYEDYYRDIRKRRAYLLNAWATGIDTSAFYLIPVPKKDPKTLHIAQAVIDTAQRRGWKELTVVTFDLHSARSRKAYLHAAEPHHISVTLIGVAFEGVTADNWYHTSSGLASGFSETVKKLYYDVVVF